jgi:hypothetical protein
MLIQSRLSLDEFSLRIGLSECVRNCCKQPWLLVLAGAFRHAVSFGESVAAGLSRAVRRTTVRKMWMDHLNNCHVIGHAMLLCC